MSNETASNNPRRVHFMLRSAPPRTAHQDMTVEERNVLHQHIAYWTDKQNQGIALVFGRVLKPNEPHGLAVIEVENADEVPKLISEDPAVIAGLMTVDFYPMTVTLGSSLRNSP